MGRRERPYSFYAATRALCGTCLRIVDAKQLIEGERVWLWKRCPAHGICPDHEQHGCLTLLEITDHCNLRCPTCYASSGPERLEHRSFAQVERMLERIVANEGEPEVVQISGGEPTLHPELFRILDFCKTKPIRHLMLNTNGLRIAGEPGFAERLASYAPHFEIYLQFDSLQEGALRTLRGADLRSVRERALDRLDALDLSTTLVVTVRRGVNDSEIGEIVRYASGRRSVRGVTFQPVQDAGRNQGYSPETDRLTLSEVRRRLLEQLPLFTAEDVLPVPCHPTAIAMAYALKSEQELLPLTRYVDRSLLVSTAKNSIVFEGEHALQREFTRRLFDTFSTAHGPAGAAESLRTLLCCLPRVEALPEIGYDKILRVIILEFLDRHTLDLHSVRKSCVHIAHLDGQRIIPFDTYNVLYRDALERETLVPLRLGAGAAAGFA